MSEELLLDEIALKEGKKWMLLTLNAEKSLNSLTLSMILSIQEKLNAWKSDKSVVGILLQGAGEKAFCAGGDIINLYEAVSTKHYAGADEFFQKEYSLDYSFHCYPKPIVSWGDGFVMGGGMGLFMGSRFKVLTERSCLAMPEITIGLYPDVGASYFLSRCPAEGAGLFCALTATRLKPADALYLNFGDFYIEHDQQSVFLERLQGLRFSDANEDNIALVAGCLAGFANSYIDSVGESELKKRQEFCLKLEKAGSFSDVDQILRDETVEEDPYLARASKTYKAGSPTSARVIHEQLRRAKGWELLEAFNMELKISSNFARHPDLREGIRALLVDRDNKPQWKPNNADAISDATIDSFFKDPWDEELTITQHKENS